VIEKTKKRGRKARNIYRCYLDSDDSIARDGILNVCEACLRERSL